MMYVDDLFKKFDGRIQLSDSKESELRRGRNALRSEVVFTKKKS